MGKSLNNGGGDIKRELQKNEALILKNLPGFYQKVVYKSAGLIKTI